MDEYKTMYLTLFNAITDALAELENADYVKTKDILITAQQQAEEIYIRNDERSEQ